MNPTNKHASRLAELSTKWAEYKSHEITLRNQALRMVETQLRAEREACETEMAMMMADGVPITRIAQAIDRKGTVFLYDIKNQYKDLIDTLMSIASQGIYSWVWGHWDDYDGTVSGTYYPSLRTTSVLTGELSRSAYQIEDRWMLADGSLDTFDVTVSSDGDVTISADRSIPQMTRGERKTYPVIEPEKAEQWVRANPKPEGDNR